MGVLFYRKFLISKKINFFWILQFLYKTILFLQFFYKFKDNVFVFIFYLC